jgi:two-component system sensor histidine kinase MtrB
MIFSRLAKAALDRFRSSLQIRALVYTVALSGTALIVLGGVLSVSIGNGLFSRKTEQSVIESERAKFTVSRIFERAYGQGTSALSQAMAEVVPELESIGISQTRQVAFLNSSTKGVPKVFSSPTSAGFDLAPVTSEFRNEVTSSDEIQTRTVQIMRAGESTPAILIGQNIKLPSGQKYELYLVYDMYNEQQSLLFVQRTLVLGGFVTLMVIGFFSFLVTSWLVKPVQEAADASELLANGDLDRRLAVRGTDVAAVLATSFNHMADSLQEKIKAMDNLSKMQQRFVSDVSHELRTPLTTMKLAADFLKDHQEGLPDFTQKSIVNLHSQMDRFDVLLADLLEISRYDADGVEPIFEVHDLNGIVGVCLEAIQPFADSKGVYLEADIPSGAVQCEVDSRRIERIVNNLLTNAIEHSEGKPVIVRVAQNDRAVAVSVTDQGIGMTQSEIGQTFDRFWRADPSRKRTTGGTGLGLSISIADAFLHLGMLEVVAEPNEGSCFRLTIPKRHDVTDIVSPLPLALEGTGL